MKKIISIFAVLSLMLLACIPAMAAVVDTDTFIYDYADVVSDDNEYAINFSLGQVNDSCETAAVIVTMPVDSTVSTNDYADVFMANTPVLTADEKPVALFVFDTASNTYDALTYYYGDNSYIDENTIDTLIDICDETVANGDYDEGILNLASNIYGFLALSNMGFGDLDLDFDYDTDTANEIAIPDVTVENNTPASNQKFVIDDAGLLTDTEISTLNQKIGEIIEVYDYQVVIHTCNSFYGKTAMEYADDYYDYNGYKDDGMIFVINMDTRDYWTSTKGFGITAFTDYGLEQIHETVVGDLSEGYYYSAFLTYLDLCDDYLEAAKSGEPYDVNNRPTDWTAIASTEVIIIAIAVILAFIAGKQQKAALNTAKIKTEANDYMIPGSLHIMASREMFIRRQISKVKKAEENHGGGSSTHTSSSGSSHGGGGGKF